jgi:hypothetical protein
VTISKLSQNVHFGTKLSISYFLVFDMREKRDLPDIDDRERKCWLTSILVIKKSILVSTVYIL